MTFLFGLVAALALCDKQPRAFTHAIEIATICFSRTCSLQAGIWMTLLKNWRR